MCLPSTNTTSFYFYQANLDVLVLDEADRLLEMGFRKDIHAILDHLPPADTRQTLLFSATMPSDLKGVMEKAMRKDLSVTVSFVEKAAGDSDSSSASHETNAAVVQSHVVLRSFDDYVSSVVKIVRHALVEGQQQQGEEGEGEGEGGKDGVSEQRPPKIVVFFPATRVTGYFAEIFNAGGLCHWVPAIEIHSRLSQGKRDRASEQFRNCKTGVLFTSDVSARGVGSLPPHPHPPPPLCLPQLTSLFLSFSLSLSLSAPGVDFPDVTHVIQIGMADSREQYIHRLGRTARAGKKGQVCLSLSLSVCPQLFALN